MRDPTNLASQTWSLIIVASVVATGILVFGDLLPPLRHVMVAWFLLLCPGMSYVRLLHIKDGLMRWTLAIGLSLAIDTTVATIFLYAGFWSTNGILLTLMAISIVGAGLQLKYVRPMHNPLDIKRVASKGAAQDE